MSADVFSQNQAGHFLDRKIEHRKWGLFRTMPRLLNLPVVLGCYSWRACLLAGWCGCLLAGCLKIFSGLLLLVCWLGGSCLFFCSLQRFALRCVAMLVPSSLQDSPGPHDILSGNESNWRTQRSLLHERSFPGWWFGTSFIFPYIGNNHPNWLSYFSEGWLKTTNQFPLRVPLVGNILQRATVSFRLFGNQT